MSLIYHVRLWVHAARLVYHVCLVDLVFATQPLTYDEVCSPNSIPRSLRRGVGSKGRRHSHIRRAGVLDIERSRQ